MGYTTDFKGSFKLSKPLTEAQLAYLVKFSGSRRMKRDAKICEKYDDSLREDVGLPIGIEGEYMALTYDMDDSVVNHNQPPSTQPGLWCHWVPTDDGTAIEWNGFEKFYAYVKWIVYIHDNFLARWGITLKGVVHYHGEDFDDRGRIKIANGQVKVYTDGKATPVITDLIKVFVEKKVRVKKINADASNKES